MYNLNVLDRTQKVAKVGDLKLCTLVELNSQNKQISMEHNKLSFEDLVGTTSLEELQPYGINSASGLFRPHKGANDLSEQGRKRIEEIRKNTIDKIIPKRVKGSQMLKDFKTKTRIFETGVEPFDDLFRSEDHILGSYLHWGDVVGEILFIFAVEIDPHTILICRNRR